MPEITIYEVGGCIRDKLYNELWGTDFPIKDIDYTVTGCESVDDMVAQLRAKGFPEPYTVDAETFTARFRVPQSMPYLFARTKDADFVWARKEGPYTDGRHPDWVQPGTLEDDLARRDFTVNAIAFEPREGTIIDPQGGQLDLVDKVLRFCGDPYQRITEDGLRVVRAFRFMITKDLTAEEKTWEALVSREAAEALLRPRVHVERLQTELEHCFKTDSMATFVLLRQLPPWIMEAMFKDGLRLSATLKGASL